MNQPLTGQVAVVTGAGRGIGRAIALAYAEAGAAICGAARTATELETLAQTIERQGGQALVVPTDVTDLAAVEKMYAQAFETFGRLDIVVINAGGNLDHQTVADGRPEDWVGTLELNLIGAYYCAKAAIPHLKANGGGKIITIGSGIGHRGRVNRSAYACSKAGLWMLTRVLAQELWQDNISVNELIPGPVDTSLTAPTSKTDEPGNVFNIDSEWIKRPEDVAPLALFLATQPTVGPTAQSFSLMRRDN
jgi:3-oxoacyl-[acyl-carrier protein] reductase